MTNLPFDRDRRNRRSSLPYVQIIYNIFGNSFNDDSNMTPAARISLVLLLLLLLDFLLKIIKILFLILLRTTQKRGIQKFVCVAGRHAWQDSDRQNYNFTVNENSSSISTERNMLLY